MSTFTLFSKWVWAASIGDNYKDLFSQTRMVDPDYISSFSQTIRGKAASTVAAFVVHALGAYLDPDNDSFLYQSDLYICCEYRSHNGDTHVVYFNKKTTELSAYIIHDGIQMPYVFDESEKSASGSALIFALIPYLKELQHQNYEAAGYIENLENSWIDRNTDPTAKDVFVKNMFRLSDFLYRAEKAGVITLDFVPFGQAPDLSNDNGSAIKGTPKYIDCQPCVVSDSANTKKTNVRKKSLREEFAIADCYGNAVPCEPSGFVVPPVLRQICALVKGKNTAGIRNVLLYGPAGTGKTLLSVAMASALNLPYYSINCSAFSDDTTLFGAILPRTSKKQKRKSEFKSIEIPSWEDVEMDPASAYAKISGGVYDESKTAADCFALMGALANTRVEEEIADSDFEFAESQFVKAFRDGGLIEIQEPTAINNAGVLVALNSALDDIATITLPTKETVHRHPNCVIVFTTNISYNGCRAMNQSLVSRCMKFPIAGLKIKDMVDRAMKKFDLGASVRGDIKLLAECCQEVEKVCEANGITDGAVGMRALIDAVQAYTVLGDLREAAIIGIANAATFDEESRTEIIESCIDKRFKH